VRHTTSSLLFAEEPTLNTLGKSVTTVLKFRVGSAQLSSQKGFGAGAPFGTVRVTKARVNTGLWILEGARDAGSKPEFFRVEGRFLISSSRVFLAPLGTTAVTVERAQSACPSRVVAIGPERLSLLGPSLGGEADPSSGRVKPTFQILGLKATEVAKFNMISSELQIKAEASGDGTISANNYIVSSYPAQCYFSVCWTDSQSLRNLDELPTSFTGILLLAHLLPCAVMEF
jgi:hypothetical protein